jgi:hypothetical protein
MKLRLAHYALAGWLIAFALVGAGIEAAKFLGLW